jgi:hypothetical protein
VTAPRTVTRRVDAAGGIPHPLPRPTGRSSGTGADCPGCSGDAGRRHEARIGMLSKGSPWLFAVTSPWFSQAVPSHRNISWPGIRGGFSYAHLRYRSADVTRRGHRSSRCRHAGIRPRHIQPPLPFEPAPAGIFGQERVRPRVHSRHRLAPSSARACGGLVTRSFDLAVPSGLVRGGAGTVRVCVGCGGVRAAGRGQTARSRSGPPVRAYPAAAGPG